MLGVSLTILLLGIYGCVAADGPTVVHTIQDGRIRGTISYTLDNAVKPIYNFRGIPYATQPIGPLRFKAPKEVEPWVGELDATQAMVECPQDYVLMKELFQDYGYGEIEEHDNESCLVLSVYTPTLNEKANLPVMFWIHGGGYALGSGRIPDGTALASLGEVVVVSINYRLAALGMLSTDNENAPGNQNLLDQVMALKWVQKNIASFGGDPSQVTIFGESAGSWSVNALSISPLATGLFNKVIGQSGTITYTPYSIQSQEMQNVNVKTLATMTGCESENTDEVLDCLRTKPYMDLIRPTPLKEDDPPLDWMWALRFGETSFPKHPNDLLEDKEIQEQLKRIKFIYGINDMEGYMFIPQMMPTFFAEKTLENWRNDMKTVLVMSIDIAPPSEDNKPLYDGVIDALIDHYFQVSDPTEEELVKAAARVCGDLTLNAPVIRTANKLRDIGADVKFYVLNKGPSHLMKFRPSYIETDHADDLFFCYGSSHTNNSQDPMLSNVIYNKEDLRMEELFVNYWLNFAKTGDPNGPNLPPWPASSTDGRNTAISLELEPTVIADYGKDIAKLCSETIPRIIKDNTPGPEKTKEEL